MSEVKKKIGKSLFPYSFVISFKQKVDRNGGVTRRFLKVQILLPPISFYPPPPPHLFKGMVIALIPLYITEYSSLVAHQEPPTQRLRPHQVYYNSIS